MKIANPVSVWEFIQDTYYDKDQVGFQTNYKLYGLDLDNLLDIKAKKKLSPKQAEQLSKVFGRSAESWLNMDALYRENMVGKEVLDYSELEVGKWFEYDFYDRSGSNWTDVKVLWIGKSHIAIEYDNWESVITKERSIDSLHPTHFRIGEKYFGGDNND